MTIHLGAFEQLILFSLLQLGDDAYGLAIRELIEERTGRAVSAGAIYTALGRLESGGLVRARSGDGSGGSPGRPRKYYALRTEGARALRESYTSLQAMADQTLPALFAIADGELAESDA